MNTGATVAMLIVLPIIWFLVIYFMGGSKNG